jgi:two-component system, sensor histidine kinase and response regulator
LTTPIIAMSANTSNDDREKAYKAGINDYLVKPLEITELERTLAKLFYKPRKEFK